MLTQEQAPGGKSVRDVNHREVIRDTKQKSHPKIRYNTSMSRGYSLTLKASSDE